MKEKLKNIFKIKNIVAFVIAIIFFITVCWIVNSHEAWLDEAQAWLISERLSITEIFEQMKYEGHPCLWHLILSIFSKNGFPYNCIGYISAAITSVMVFFLAKNSPFSVATIFTIIISPIVLYQYSVISRVYCIAILCLVLVASLYKDRRKKPILYAISLAFLIHTHIIVEGLVAALCIVFFGYEFLLHFKDYSKKEKVKMFISMGIVLFAILLLFVQLYSSLDNCTNVKDKPFFLGYPVFDELRLVNIIDGFFEGITGSFSQKIITYIALLAFTIISLKKHPKEGLMWVVSVIYIFFVFLFVYRLVSHTRYMIYMIFIFIAWIILEKEEKFHIKLIYEGIIIIVMLINIIANFADVFVDISASYSGAKHIAEYINRELDDNTIILTTSSDEITPIVPYIEKEKNIKFLNLNNDREITFCIWDDTHYKRLSAEKLIEKVEKFKENNEEVYIVIPWGYIIDEIEELKEEYDLTHPIYEYKYTVMGERYEMFKLK